MSALGMKLEVSRDMPYSRNGLRYRFVDESSSEEDRTIRPGDASQCCAFTTALYCAPTTGDRNFALCQITNYTITGGIIGIIAGCSVPGPGNAVGLGIGLGIGFVFGCVKSVCDNV